MNTAVKARPLTKTEIKRIRTLTEAVILAARAGNLRQEKAARDKLADYCVARVVQKIPRSNPPPRFKAKHP